MRIIGITSALLFLSFTCVNSLTAQDDETRQATGLPIMIGRNATNRSFTTLSGKITILGNDASKPLSSFFVAVYANGVLIDRRAVMDSGNYYIPSIPRESVILSVEVGGIEVGRYQLMSSVMGSVRHDVSLSLAEIRKAQAKPGVISAKDFYQRSNENQKIFDKAVLALKDKKIDAAVSLYNQLLVNDPKDFVAWTELGTAYFRNEKYSEAENSYGKALEQKPDFIVAQVNLGKLYLSQKQLEKAEIILSKAAEMNPASAEAQHYLGEAYLQNKKGSKAVVHLNEAIKLEPIANAEIHLRLAQLYNAANLKDKAIEEYKFFLAKIPDYKEKPSLRNTSKIIRRNKKELRFKISALLVFASKYKI